MLRRHFLGGSAAALLRKPSPAEQPFPESWFKSPVIHAPDDPAEWPAWREKLTLWRREAKARLNYDDSLYRRDDFAWVPSSFACCFLMLFDEKFLNRERGTYMVDEFLDEGEREFGGWDSVVLWHAYPRIGLDERNQFDFYRDMPGGLDGLREATRRFQARGVRVFLNYNPWDTGTRREEVSDIDALVRLVQSLGADGIFLDTLHRGSAEFRAKLDSVRRGVVLESELELPLENVKDHHMSWAQGFIDSRVPGVLRNKWFERRHMQHQIRRWNHDHTDELHAAWMNGSGIMVWENVFGSWVGWNARDRSILRSMLPIQRRYWQLFAGEGWTPLVPTEMPGVYASLWELGGIRLWTVVNRTQEQREGVVIRAPHVERARYFDLIRGREIKASPKAGAVPLPGSIRPRGIACFLAAAGPSLGPDFERFLQAQAAIDARADFRAGFPRRQVSPRLLGSRARERGTLEGMVEIGPARYTMTVEFRVRETGFYTGQEYCESVTNPGPPVQDYRPASGARMFQLDRLKRQVKLAPYAIDLTPVTNAQFAEFLKRSGYRPKRTANFLRHWKNGAPPPGLEDHPVVWVDLDDARAYAAWAGKRLPTEEEWQYAAQGPDGLRYPWGNAIRHGVCNAGQTGGTTPVKAFPGGRSPFGCWDMCGNTWEWTESERSDGRTRFAIIRGGSYFEARGSRWYMDGGPQPCNFAAKMILIWRGLDRCSTIGFRCAVSLL